MTLMRVIPIRKEGSPYDCDRCLFKDSLCDVCEEGDHFEEDFDLGNDFDNGDDEA